MSTSQKRKTVMKINVHANSAMSELELGTEGMVTLCSVLGMPPPSAQSSWDIKIKKIKSSLYSPYHAEACNELRGPSPRLSAWAKQLRGNVAAVASRWRHCADLTGPGIEPQTSRTDSALIATELTAGPVWTCTAIICPVCWKWYLKRSLPSINCVMPIERQIKKANQRKIKR